MLQRYSANIAYKGYYQIHPSRRNSLEQTWDSGAVPHTTSRWQHAAFFEWRLDKMKRFLLLLPVFELPFPAYSFRYQRPCGQPKQSVPELYLLPGRPSKWTLPECQRRRQKELICWLLKSNNAVECEKLVSAPPNHHHFIQTIGFVIARKKEPAITLSIFLPRRDAETRRGLKWRGLF